MKSPSNVRKARVFGLLLATAAVFSAPAAPGAAPAPATVTLPASTLQQYVGRYRLGSHGVLRITLSDGQLHARLTGQPAFPVYASARDEFFYKVTDAQLSFKRGDDGKVDALVLHQHGKDMRAPRVATAEKAVTLPQKTLREYVGRYRLGPHAVFSITLSDGRLQAQLTGQPSVSIHPSARDEFFYTQVDARISFKRGDDGKVDALVLHQNGKDMRAPRFSSTAAGPSATAARALAARLASEKGCLSAHPLNVKTDAGTLYGVVTVPKGASAAPGIILIPGSGAPDLNGDAPPVLRNHIYQQLAYALTCHGYAVLRYDKRGVGKSTGAANDTTIQDYRSDVIALAGALRKQPGVAADRLILMGHSEGGLIAPYTAPKLGDELRAVVLLEAPGETLDKIVIHQSLREYKAHGASKKEVAEFKRQARQFFRALRKSNGADFQVPKGLQDFALGQQIAHAAKWFRSDMMIHPTRRIARLEVPVLIVQGTADVQVGVRNARRLHAADPDATLAMMPHMTHDLIVAHGDPFDFATPSPGAQLDPALVKRVVEWLNDTVKPAS